MARQSRVGDCVRWHWRGDPSQHERDEGVFSLFGRLQRAGLTCAGGGYLPQTTVNGARFRMGRGDGPRDDVSRSAPDRDLFEMYIK